MATITHAHIDVLGDDAADAAAGKVVGTDWNANHTFSSTGSGAIVQADRPTLTNTVADTPGLIVTGNSSTVAPGTAALRVNTAWNTTDYGRGIELNVTNTASASGSYLINCNCNGAAAFDVRYTAASGLAEFSAAGRLSFFSLGDKLLFGTASGTRWTIETDGCLLNWNPAVINPGAVTVANLPANHGAGARISVTDATLTHTAGIGTVVIGGGGNCVPVHYDGANWRIG
jgi:hypothetical protein